MAPFYLHKDIHIKEQPAIEQKTAHGERQLFAVTLGRSRICIIPLVLIEQINEALLNVCLSESGDKIKIEK